MNIERNEFGTGDALVIMHHGNSLDSTIFMPLINELINKYKIITLCLPEHGNSERPDKYNIRDLSQSIVDNINIETVTKYILAHSLSGHLILQEIHKLKDVARVICVGTPALGEITDITSAFTRGWGN